MNARRGILALLLLALTVTAADAQVIFFPNRGGFGGYPRYGFGGYPGGFGGYPGAYGGYPGGFGGYPGYGGYPYSPGYNYPAPINTFYYTMPTAPAAPAVPTETPRARPTLHPAIPYRPAPGYLPAERADRRPQDAPAANQAAAITNKQAQIDITLPTADAVVTINGTPMTGQTGRDRTYFTSPISGQDTVYQIQVDWTENGQARQKTKRQPVTPGGRYTWNVAEEG